MPIPAIAMSRTPVTSDARHGLRWSPGFLAVAIEGPAISGMIITPSRTRAAMIPLAEKPAPRPVHSDNHSEMDCVVQNDQRMQIALKVASVFTESDSRLVHVEDRLPIMRSLP